MSAADRAGAAVAAPVLECRTVGKRYGGLDALSEVSFEVLEGEVLGVIGPNGAGKTTLFDVVSGASRATSGQVMFGGTDVTRLPGDAIARLGLLRTFQTPQSFPDLSVRDNVLVGVAFAGRQRTRSTASAAVEAALAACGLEPIARERAGPLSVLNRKRLMIATALAARPRLLLLDEPMGGLNADERQSMLALLLELNARGMTLLVIEHVMSALQQLARRVVILDQGRVIFRGATAEALADPEVMRVYLGDGAGHA